MKIASTITFEPAQRELISRAVPDAEIIDRRANSVDDVNALAAEGCDVLLGFIFPKDLPKRAPGLKWVQLLSAGSDHVPREALKNSKIVVTTASGIHATAISEYTIASMLAYGHRLHLSIRAQLQHEWRRNGVFMTMVEELRGKVLGVVGYGSIGRETARMAQALGMRVLALKRDHTERRDLGWTPTGLGDPEGLIPERFYAPEDCAALLRESDYVTVTLPLTPATRKFIGPNEIAAMKPGAYIVNIGRGEVIDEAALIEALKGEKIGGAGLDVFEHEPLEPESPLWDMENVIMTPHMSGAHKGYMTKACELFADNLKRFASGKALLNVVDPALEY